MRFLHSALYYFSLFVIAFFFALALISMANASEKSGFIQEPSSHLDMLYNATAELLVNGKRTCSVSQISHDEFLTAKHCVRDLGENHHFRIVRNNNTGEEVKFIQTSMTHREDWAILKTTTLSRKEGDRDYPLEVSCDYELKLGNKVAYAGYPAGSEHKVLGLGYISSLRGTKFKEASADFLVDIPANRGASGSPIIDVESGKIIGVLVEALNGIGNAPYLIGVQDIKESILCQ